MENLPSKSRIDRAGATLSDDNATIDVSYLEMEEVFEIYRRFHLPPLTRLSLELQRLLENSQETYYLAQRLKRKPQILRKLRRFKSRLTQLQDIGGARIILENNFVLDKLSDVIDQHINSMPDFHLHRNTDYRPNGRDDSGYRSLHKIISYKGIKLEI